MHRNDRQTMHGIWAVIWWTLICCGSWDERGQFVFAVMKGKTITCSNVNLYNIISLDTSDRLRSFYVQKSNRIGPIVIHITLIGSLEIAPNLHSFTRIIEPFADEQIHRLDRSLGIDPI